MRRIVLFYVFLLTACSASQPTLTATPAAPTVTLTPAAPTPTISPTPSATPLTTATPAPPTRTPLPTFALSVIEEIPTFTPTFNARTVVTMTPALKAKCPKENPDVSADFPENTVIPPEKILSYLNAGGTLNIFKQRPELLSTGKVMDVTGDGVEEIIAGFFGGRYNFIECNDGKYQLASFYFDINTSTSSELRETLDLNQNGIPEIIFTSAAYKRDHNSIYIYEWDGSATFRSLIRLKRDPFHPSQITDWVDTVSPYSIKDSNGDGLKEIIIVDDVLLHQYKGSVPARKEIVTLGWDGTYYINFQPENYGPPKYRFQAIQDADRQVLYGNYQKALALYRQAIFNTALDWWSYNRAIYFLHAYPRSLETAEPTPAPDPGVYEILVAYAHYRIVILHAYLGEMDAAKVQYDTLQKKFPEGNPGHPYAEIATFFWERYQSSGNMTDACDQASFYADSEILEPLGKFFFGAQSHTYRPEDICPFPLEKPK